LTANPQQRGAVGRPAPRDRLVDLAFRTAWSLTRRTPEKAGVRAFQTVADGVWRRHGARVDQLEANLRRAAPGAGDAAIRELSRAALRSYFRYWHEAFRMPSLSPQRVVDGVVTSGEEPLRAEFGRGGGAIIALPHMANWDLAGAWACLTGMPVSTVAERLQPESLYDQFVRYREELGMEVLPLTGGARSPLPALLRSLSGGRLICLLADRPLGASVEVSLLGERARVAAGPAVVARMALVPMFAATLTYEGPLMRIEFSPPIEPQHGRDGLVSMAQETADWFSAGIRRSPPDWHMMQPVFTADLDAVPT
jgi:phosphatidylinositol dimannoside acyltransferase